MKYLGMVKRENGSLTMPDAFRETAECRDYEAVEVGGDILLLSAPLNRQRMRQIEELANASITDHRRTLEGLAR